MKTRKVWFGVGTALVASPALSAPLPRPAQDDPALAAPPALVLAQHAGHGAAKVEAAPAKGDGEGEGGGPRDASLPPALVFYRNVEVIRGHLLVGNELVEAGRWAEALPHFLHPTEEIYGGIRAQLKTYDTPPFETALKALAQTVKAKNKEAYGRALVTVRERLDAAEKGARAKAGGPLAPFALETALETLKVAAGEYENALDGKRIKLAVEYQDSRGFVWEAERLVESVAPELGRKNEAGLAAIRAAFADLKKAWPDPMPPRMAVRDLGEVLADISRIELQSSTFE